MFKISTRTSTLGAMPKEDAATFVDWVWKAREINAFDPSILTYPRTVMLTADDSEGPVLFLPVQPVLMLESLAPRPGLSPRKEALALWKLGECLEQVSRDTGIQEQYFLCKDPRVTEICSKHGWEILEGYSILRKKIAVPELPQDINENNHAN